MNEDNADQYKQTLLLESQLKKQTYPLHSSYVLAEKYKNDEYQQQVIELDQGRHLVLAPPGCGKTDILAERVVRALLNGVSPDNILCLTFTNRAARSMIRRIKDRVQESITNAHTNHKSDSERDIVAQPAPDGTFEACTQEQPLQQASSFLPQLLSVQPQSNLAQCADRTVTANDAATANNSNNANDAAKLNDVTTTNNTENPDTTNSVDNAVTANNADNKASRVDVTNSSDVVHNAEHTESNTHYDGSVSQSHCKGTNQTHCEDTSQPHCEDITNRTDKYGAAKTIHAAIGGTEEEEQAYAGINVQLDEHIQACLGESAALYASWVESKQQNLPALQAPQVIKVNEQAEENSLEHIFVGNVHRFCSHFLFDAEVIPKNTVIIDDAESLSIMHSLLNLDEKLCNIYRLNFILKGIINLQHMIYQIAGGCPENMVLHQEILQLVKKFFVKNHLVFNAENISKLFNGEMHSHLRPTLPYKALKDELDDDDDIAKSLYWTGHQRLKLITPSLPQDKSSSQTFTQSNSQLKSQSQAQEQAHSHSLLQVPEHSSVMSLAEQIEQQQSHSADSTKLELLESSAASNLATSSTATSNIAATQPITSHVLAQSARSEQALVHSQVSQSSTASSKLDSAASSTEKSHSLQATDLSQSVQSVQEAQDIQSAQTTNYVQKDAANETQSAKIESTKSDDKNTSEETASIAAFFAEADQEDPEIDEQEENSGFRSGWARHNINHQIKNAANRFGSGHGAEFLAESLSKDKSARKAASKIKGKELPEMPERSPVIDSRQAKVGLGVEFLEHLPQDQKYGSDEINANNEHEAILNSDFTSEFVSEPNLTDDNTTQIQAENSSEGQGIDYQTVLNTELIKDYKTPDERRQEIKDAAQSRVEAEVIDGAIYGKWDDDSTTLHQAPSTQDCTAPLSITEKNYVDVLSNPYLQLALAWAYQQYKIEHCLLDFDDLLIKTYNYALHHQDSIKKYSWVQVDEMQDLSPFQFGIIDLFTDRSKNAVTVYLGDEQQAIFSFTGANISTLADLRLHCANNLHFLYNNYRSPQYLLQLFNTYAQEQLKVEARFLSHAQNNMQPDHKALRMYTIEDKERESGLVYALIREFLSFHPHETVAVLVPWNKDADLIARRLKLQSMRFFQISGSDLFTLPPARLMFAHLQCLYNPNNIMAWSRLLAACKVFKSFSLSRKFVKKLRDACILPSDLLMYSSSSYMLEFKKHCYYGEYVVFDAETTGLKVFEDDIVQIAAVKMQGYQVVDHFNIFLRTDKALPEKIAGDDNPMIYVYEQALNHNRLTERPEGLQQFLKFIGNCPLVGHNVEFDYRMLETNLWRDCGCKSFAWEHPLYFDTMRLSQIIFPRLKKYSLNYLFEFLKLGNVRYPHFAEDDVATTAALVRYVMEVFSKYEPYHRYVLQKYAKQGKQFKDNYADVYVSAQLRLHVAQFTLAKDLASKLKVRPHKNVSNQELNELELSGLEESLGIAASNDSKLSENTQLEQLSKAEQTQSEPSTERFSEPESPEQLSESEQSEQSKLFPEQLSESKLSEQSELSNERLSEQTPSDAAQLEQAHSEKYVPALEQSTLDRIPSLPEVSEHTVAFIPFQQDEQVVKTAYNQCSSFDGSDNSKDSPSVKECTSTDHFYSKDESVSEDSVSSQDETTCDNPALVKAPAYSDCATKTSCNLIDSQKIAQHQVSALLEHGAVGNAEQTLNTSQEISCRDSNTALSKLGASDKQSINVEHVPYVTKQLLAEAVVYEPSALAKETHSMISDIFAGQTTFDGNATQSTPEANLSKQVAASSLDNDLESKCLDKKHSESFSTELNSVSVDQSGKTQAKSHVEPHHELKSQSQHQHVGMELHSDKGLRLGMGLLFGLDLDCTAPDAQRSGEVIQNKSLSYNTQSNSSVTESSLEQQLNSAQPSLLTQSSQSTQLVHSTQSIHSTHTTQLSQSTPSTQLSQSIQPTQSKDCKELTRSTEKIVAEFELNQNSQNTSQPEHGFERAANKVQESQNANAAAPSSMSQSLQNNNAGLGIDDVIGLPLLQGAAVPVVNTTEFMELASTESTTGVAGTVSADASVKAQNTNAEAENSKQLTPVVQCNLPLSSAAKSAEILNVEILHKDSKEQSNVENTSLTAGNSAIGNSALSRTLVNQEHINAPLSASQPVHLKGYFESTDYAQNGADSSNAQVNSKGSGNENKGKKEQYSEDGLAVLNKLKELGLIQPKSDKRTRRRKDLSYAAQSQTVMQGQVVSYSQGQALIQGRAVGYAQSMGLGYGLSRAQGQAVNQVRTRVSSACHSQSSQDSNSNLCAHSQVNSNLCANSQVNSNRYANSQAAWSKTNSAVVKADSVSSSSTQRQSQSYSQSYTTQHLSQANRNTSGTKHTFETKREHSNAYANTELSKACTGNCSNSTNFANGANSANSSMRTTDTNTSMRTGGNNASLDTHTTNFSIRGNGNNVSMGTNVNNVSIGSNGTKASTGSNGANTALNIVSNFMDMKVFNWETASIQQRIELARQEVQAASDAGEPIIVDELKRFYRASMQRRWCKGDGKMRYIFHYLTHEMVDVNEAPSLYEQLSHYLMDLITLRETDLCESNSIKEKVFISTVHKAKGLEFDNVIIFEAADDVYPFYNRRRPEDFAESARLFYVAMTRAKKRLVILCSNNYTGISRKGRHFNFPRVPTTFLRCIMKYFQVIHE